MRLVQVDTFTVSSAVSSVTIGGGSSGSSSYNFAINTDDVYMVVYNNWKPVTDTVVQKFRLTKSGTAQSDSEYDSSYKELKSGASFSNGALANQQAFQFEFTGSDTGETGQGIIYLYNFNSSSEYSFVSFETVTVNHVAWASGVAGGGAHSVASASDGLNFHFHSGNIASGTFTMYKVI